VLAYFYNPSNPVILVPTDGTAISMVALSDTAYGVAGSGSRRSQSNADNNNAKFN
jgi:hypothetical protein